MTVGKRKQQQLQTRDKEIVEAYKVGVTYADIAYKMGISISTVAAAIQLHNRKVEVS